MKLTIGQEVQVCFDDGWFIGDLKEVDDEFESLTLGGAIPLYSREEYEGKIPDKVGKPTAVWVYSRTNFTADPERWDRFKNRSLPEVSRG